VHIRLDANWVEAIAATATFLVALLVFLEARKIRRTEGILRQNQAWNDFGNAVATLEDQAMERILLGREPADPPRTARESFLLMSFFNVVSSDYSAFRVGAIDPRYVVHSLTFAAEVVIRNQAWVFGFLNRHGYDAGFVRMLAIIAVTGLDVDRRNRALRHELRALSWLARTCGPKVQAWLRKGFEAPQIAQLCQQKHSAPAAGDTRMEA